MSAAAELKGGETKALVIFCEGAHDIAYVSQIMKHCFGYKQILGRKFDAYPAPFNSFFLGAFDKRRAATPESGADMAYSFDLPDKAFEGENRIVFIFNSGGKTKLDRIKLFLARFLLLLEEKETFDSVALPAVSEVKYLFIYDADDWGVEKTRAEVRRSLAEIDGAPWLADEWDVDQNNPYAACIGEKGMYIWGETPEQGSLEDLLHPLFAKDNAKLISEAESTIDNMFAWDTTNTKTKTAVAETAKRKKAIFTLIGQREKPGGSMHVILDQAGLITPATLTGDKAIMDFVRFVAEFAP